MILEELTPTPIPRNTLLRMRAVVKLVLRDSECAALAAPIVSECGPAPAPVQPRSEAITVEVPVSADTPASEDRGRGHDTATTAPILAGAAAVYTKSPARCLSSANKSSRFLVRFFHVTLVFFDVSALSRAATVSRTRRITLNVLVRSLCVREAALDAMKELGITYKSIVANGYLLDPDGSKMDKIVTYIFEGPDNPRKLPPSFDIKNEKELSETEELVAATILRASEATT